MRWLDNDEVQVVGLQCVGVRGSQPARRIGTTRPWLLSRVQMAAFTGLSADGGDAVRERGPSLDVEEDGVPSPAPPDRPWDETGQTQRNSFVSKATV